MRRLSLLSRFFFFVVAAFLALFTLQSRAFDSLFVIVRPRADSRDQRTAHLAKTLYLEVCFGAELVLSVPFVCFEGSSLPLPNLGWWGLRARFQPQEAASAGQTPQPIPGPLGIMDSSAAAENYSAAESVPDWSVDALFEAPANALLALAEGSTQLGPARDGQPPCAPRPVAGPRLKELGTPLTQADVLLAWCFCAAAEQFVHGCTTLPPGRDRNKYCVRPNCGRRLSSLIQKGQPYRFNGGFQCQQCYNRQRTPLKEIQLQQQAQATPQQPQLTPVKRKPTQAQECVFTPEQVAQLHKVVKQEGHGKQGKVRTPGENAQALLVLHYMQSGSAQPAAAAAAASTAAPVQRTLSFNQAASLTSTAVMMSPTKLRQTARNFKEHGQLKEEHAPRIERTNPLHKQFGQSGMPLDVLAEVEAHVQQASANNRYISLQTLRAHLRRTGEGHLEEHAALVVEAE